MKRQGRIAIAVVTLISIDTALADDVFIAREILVRGGYGYAFGLSSSDINGDGLADLVTTDIHADKQSSNLYWLENLGGGNFTEHTVATGVHGWLERQAVGDLNVDGRPDIVVVNNTGNVVWYVQVNAGWEARPLAHIEKAYNVALGDIDGDGYPDSATVNMFRGQVHWHTNPGSQKWVADWPSQVIDSGLVEARTVAIADINGDGRADVLAAAVGSDDALPSQSEAPTIVWYENNGSGWPLFGRSWTKHIIDNTSRAPVHGHPIDMDGDGDIDIVMAFGLREPITGTHEIGGNPTNTHHIAWYENIRNGAHWRKHTIAHLPYAFEAVAGDLDGNGRVSVVATAWAKGDRMVLYRHSGDPTGEWTSQVIKQDWPAANQPILVDLTGNGKLDICATADDGSGLVDGANELRCWVSGD